MVEETISEATDVAPASVRYTALEVEARKVAGRDVEFRTVEVGGLELRAVKGEDTAMPMRFSGYAAVFDSPSEPLPFIETIAPGAFSRSLQSGRETRMFLNHNTDHVLASTKSGSLIVSEDERGLMVDAELPDTSYGRDLSVLIRRGDVHSMSFGFSVPSGGESRSSDGKSRRLNEVILHEVSVVTGFPAYAATEGAQVRTTEELPAEPEDEQTTGRSVALAQRYLALNAKR
jgi:HK97 family phage prohead protease